MKHETAIPVGSGGMGEVFKAWDPDLERYVAFKYLKHDDPVLVERLLREAKAQARIDHPSVCKVYEVGEDDGRPYIAMEFVDGETLDQAAKDLTTEQKVLLVKRVTEAIQAAHTAGLVHRDLKPANILVVEREGEPHPYVLDFGIARIEEVAGLTMTGQVMGTPGYLSPEQARGDLETIDRRTDVFSLGVILYELLGDARPFNGESQVEILLSLLEAEPAPLRAVNPSVPRDLETVVMTCLQKDSERRYPSARALADDLGRFLDGEPVEARPVGFAERVARKAHKNPLTTAAVGLAAIALLALAIGGIGGWIKYTADLKRERDIAEANAAEAREVTDFLVDVFSSADPNEAEGREITADEILANGAEKIETELGDRPEIQARLFGILGEVYSRLGQYERAEPLLERSFEATMSIPDRSPEMETMARVRLADLCVHLDKLDRAIEVIGPAREVVAATPELDADHAVQALDSYSRVQFSRDEIEESETALETAIEIAEHELGADAPLTSDLLNNMCSILYEQARFPEAIPICRRAVELRRAAYGDNDPRVATALSNLANVLSDTGDLEEAVAIGEEVLTIRRHLLGPEHPRVATTLNNLGLSYKKMGNLDRAEELYIQSLELRKKIYGETHPRVATALSNLGGVYRDRNDLDRAEDAYRQGYEITLAAYGPDHTRVADSTVGLSQIAYYRGDYEEAIRLTQRVQEIREANYGTNSPTLTQGLRFLGMNCLKMGDLDKAEKHLLDARSIAVEAWGENPARLDPIDEMLEMVNEARNDGG